MTKRAVLLVIAIIVLAFAYHGIAIWASSIWFASVGYSSLFWIPFKLAWGYGLLGGFIFAIVTFFSFVLLKWNLRRAMAQIKSVDSNVGAGYVPKSSVFTTIGYLAVILLFILGAMITGSQWLEFTKALNAVNSSYIDPIFHLNAGFYLFKLPAYLSITSDVLILTILLGIITVITYGLFFSRYLVNYTDIRKVLGYAIGHVGLLVSIIIFAWSAGDWLARYATLTNYNGLFEGAGYTSVHVLIPLYAVKAALAALLGLLVLGVSLSRLARGTRGGRVALRSDLLPLGGALVLLLAVSILGTVYAGVYERLVVSPNQAVMQVPYIAYNMAATNLAYGTDKVSVRRYPAKGQLTAADLSHDAGTIQNLRIMDQKPLAQAYSQLQGLRPYYNFSCITLDRYSLGGKETEVLLAPREMDQDNLPDTAKTWVNLHERYTHGYGIVVSPVNEANAQGEPDFIDKDIPMQGPLPVSNPEIYYGLDTTNWVLTDTAGGEFNYPNGSKNAINYYKSKGISLADPLNKLIFSLNMETTRFYLDKEITPATQLLLHRQIQDRVGILLPYLHYDHNPYMVVANGKLYWIIDAYTTSSNFPYSEATNNGSRSLNYIRNSVKVVINAYSGKTTFYQMPQSDPIIEVFDRIFPGVFKPYADMPAAIQREVLYPEDLFNIQANILQLYHMSDPVTFYNREGAWSQASEQYAGNATRSEVYYAIVRLPGSTRSEFVLMSSFTPYHRQNMISWLAARMGSHYGQLVLEEFPKGYQVYGPMQVESLINQNPTISQAFTLWNQHGSEVIEGNLLAIPVHGSILYVEPVFLTASNGQGIPELKRVIAGVGDTVVMARTVDGALRDLTGAAPAPATVSKSVAASNSLQYLIGQAWQEYQAARAAMEKGDWTAYGRHISNLGPYLKQLHELHSSPSAG